MALTPVEIRHIRLRKALFGYQAKQTDELLADVVVSFEDVWRDRADLADKLEQMEAELVRYRELEQLLRTTLISAERASQQMTDQTRRESEAVLGEARAEAREIVREAMAERERLYAEVNRLRAQLAAVLEHDRRRRPRAGAGRGDLRARPARFAGRGAAASSDPVPRARTARAARLGRAGFSLATAADSAAVGHPRRAGWTCGGGIGKRAGAGSRLEKLRFAETDRARARLQPRLPRAWAQLRLSGGAKMPGSLSSARAWRRRHRVETDRRYTSRPHGEPLPRSTSPCRDGSWSSRPRRRQGRRSRPRKGSSLPRGRPDSRAPLQRS